MRKDAHAGVLLALAAFAIWGVSPLYYAMLNDVPAMEVFAHRTIWALPLIALYLVASGGWGGVGAVARSPRSLGAMALASMAISINWFVFIYAIQIGSAVEASFGYYVYPILAVLLGAVMLGERIGPSQRLAAAIAGLGVVWIAVSNGTAPWIALVVAGSFALYGIIRKRAPVGASVGVLWELAFVVPLALLWLATGGSGAFGSGWGVSLLLAGCAVMTALPQILYVEAAKRLDFSTAGILFYLNPTLQFICALLLGETLSLPTLAAFGLIWIGVALYCRDLLRQGGGR